MTDNDIKKALESYINDITCAKCGFKDQYLLGVIISALDYINRLQTENKRLDKEVDRLSQVVLYNDGVTEMKVEETKAEAYKERIEKVKKLWGMYQGYEFEIKLDNLLNELVGDGNG